jgi:hypothetical protein
VAKSLSLSVGDLVTLKKNRAELFIVIGFTYRVSRWGNQRLIKLFSISESKQKFILESALKIISPAKDEKILDN